MGRLEPDHLDGCICAIGSCAIAAAGCLTPSRMGGDVFCLSALLLVYASNAAPA
jgi:hypothetical protein